MQNVCSTYKRPLYALGLCALLGLLLVCLTGSHNDSLNSSTALVSLDSTKDLKDPHNHKQANPFSVELGSLVSFACFSPDTYYLRHTSFMILAKEIENNEDFRLSSSFIID